MKEKVNRLAVFTKGIIKENPNQMCIRDSHKTKKGK